MSLKGLRQCDTIRLVHWIIALVTGEKGCVGQEELKETRWEHVVIIQVRSYNDPGRNNSVGVRSSWVMNYFEDEAGRIYWQTERGLWAEQRRQVQLRWIVTIQKTRFLPWFIRIHDNITWQASPISCKCLNCISKLLLNKTLFLAGSGGAGL